MSTDQIKIPESNRMANIGEPIKLKKLGKTVYVRELPIEGVIRCASELGHVLALVPTLQTDDGISLLTAVLGNASTMKALRVFAAESTGMSVDEWTDVPTRDRLVFIAAAKKVNDWEEWKELFMGLGLKTFFQTLSNPQESPSVPTSVSPTELPSS